MKLYKDLYEYRELLKTNVKKDIRGKYKGSFLGILWSFINPLLQVVVYAIVFSFVMRTQIDNYIIYLCIGVIPWTFFITVINQGIIAIRSNAGIIKKVYFPREILPISIVCSGLINFLISCVIILLFTILGGVGVSWHLVFLPFVALIQTMFSLGMVLALSAINVYIKDVEYIVQFILNMLFYATPILYSMDIFPNQLQWVLKLNPMAHIITAYRDIFLYHQMIGVTSWAYMIICAVAFFFVGLWVFKKLERGFAEEI